MQNLFPSIDLKLLVSLRKASAMGIPLWKAALINVLVMSVGRDSLRQSEHQWHCSLLSAQPLSLGGLVVQLQLHQPGTANRTAQGKAQPHQ